MITLNTDADQKLERLIISLKEIDGQSEVGSRIVRTIALDVLAGMRYRIQNRQRAADGSIIGEYSAKPIYVNIKDSPGGASLGRPLGKPFKGKRRSTFATWHGFPVTGKDHKSRYFPGGYREYKSKIYPGLSGVNLTLTGTMMNQLTVIKTSNGWGIGWGNVEYADRARGFEAKYRKRIFGASSEELRQATRIAKRLIANAVSKTTS